MKKVAMIEKTKTPYRPPFFEYLGEYVDLSVFYAGRTPAHRQWDADHTPQKYTEVQMQTKDIGPFTIAPGLKQQLASVEYDEVIAASELNMLLNSYIALLIAKRSDAKLTIWSEDIDTPWVRGQNRALPLQMVKNTLRPGINYVKKKLLRSADKIVAYSRLAARTALSNGAHKSSVMTAPQWYPPEILSSPTTSVESALYRILFVGGLTERKGIDVLIDAAEECGNEEEVEFVIAGDGPLRELVSNTAERNQHINYLGYIDEQKKANEFASADLFVLPSRHDPWGLVINESYLFETPAVTTDAAGAEMIVPSELTVPAGDAESLLHVLRWAQSERPTATSQPPIREMAAPLIGQDV